MEMEVRLLKNRDGEQVETDIYWDMKTMKFADSFQLEQIRKLRQIEQLKALEAEGKTIDPETGEIVPESDGQYRIGAAAAAVDDTHEEEEDGPRRIQCDG
jgi:hypothetical protein